jgi:methyl coenzyme M reductase subunit C-like uncharacterized protein (methanogenesis marker protein 7)
MGWRNDIRLELMREAAAEQRRCRRCGAPLEEGYDVICLKCDYDDWHEEIPDVFPEEDGDAS